MMMILKEYKKILASNIRRTKINKALFFPAEFLNTIKKESI